MNFLEIFIKFLVVLPIVTLISSPMNAEIKKDRLSDQAIVETIIDSRICKAAKKYKGLELVTRGSLNDALVDKIRGKKFAFQAYGKLNNKIARLYLVQLTLDILKIYNEEKSYRKYLFEWPFNLKNIKLSIISFPNHETIKTSSSLISINLISQNVFFNHSDRFSLLSSNDTDLNDQCDQEKELKEGFRTALIKVINRLSKDQIATAKSLGLVNSDLEDEETSADREYRSEIDSKELWLLHYDKLLKEGTISRENFYKDTIEIIESNLTQWEQDIVFPDEKTKALYQKKADYLKGEKEWEN